ncbi:hypothetical protein Glove_355g68 [Diversispora epigaea]|uniref:ORC1/DEAH AAA+ ATPase domain-containing protein n=1 Tax=Diversispora epigaea TaxID=1348612 RepID=A0A397HBH7_9GLOM|nr:hypothetical protein Glove_355g68 [Diversispora epigaea]
MNLLKSLFHICSVMLFNFRSHQVVTIRSYSSTQEKKNTVRQTEEILKKYWNSFKNANPSKKSTRNKILFTTGIGILAYYLYLTYESLDARVKKMSNVFEKGKINQKIKMFSKNLIKRENLENTLIQILQDFSGGNYYLIMGEHGTGKSTLIRNTILKLKEPKGVVHFECPSEMNNFTKELANHLDSHKGFTWYIKPVENSKYPTWNLLKAQLVNMSYYYEEKYKRPVVLVLDQVDRIAKKDSEFLGILQDFAKDCADNYSLVIIFVASEGLVSRLLQSRSAWSRASISFEVGDIPDEEAVKFLQNFAIDPKIAERVVKYLTGGRFALLNQFQKLNRYRINSFEEFKMKLFKQIKKDLDMIEFSINHKIFTKLIEVHRIDISQAKFDIPLNMIHKLIEVNILKENQDYTVSFHSRYVDTFFREQIKPE